MKLPRDLSGAQLVKALAVLGYRVTRQSGSHVRLTCEQPSQHHVTIPNHLTSAWERWRPSLQRSPRITTCPGKHFSRRSLAVEGRTLAGKK